MKGMNKMTKSKNYFLLALVFLSIILIFLMTYLFIDVGEKKTEQEYILEQTSSLGDYLLKYYPITNTATLSNQDKLYYAFIAIQADDKKHIAAEDIENIIKNTFGSKISHEDVVDSQKNKLFTYNSKKNRYDKVKDTYYFTGYQYGLITDIVELKKIEDTYIVKTRNLFVEKTTEKQKKFDLYLSYQEYSKKENPIYTVTNRKKFDPIAVINQNKDQIPVITYTYKLVDGMYILESIV